MGFFDSLSSLFDSGGDPLRAAQLRGGLLGAAQAISQPYGNIGGAFVGAGLGAQAGKDQYLSDDYQALRNQQLKLQTAQKSAQRAAQNRLLLGTAAPPMVPSQPPMQQQQPSPAANLPQAVSPIAPQAMASQAPPRIPAGFNNLDEFHTYAMANPEDAMKRLYPEPQPFKEAPHEGLNPNTGQMDQFLVEPVTGAIKWLGTGGGKARDFNQPFNADGTPNKAYQDWKRNDQIAGRQPQHSWQLMTDPQTQQQFRYDLDSGNAFTLDGQPYAPKGAQKLASTVAFTPEESNLMGALAERGVSLPAGMRSREQQKALYQGILSRNAGKSPDDIADLIKKGQIELGAQKKETQTAAGVAGKVEVAQNEMEEFIPLVREAAAKVPRGNFIPVSRLLQMADTSISDPNLKVLKGRINALMNAYDMLAARGGSDVGKRQEAHALLTSADGPEALNAQLDSFALEGAAAHRAAVKATKVPELSPSADAPKSRMLPKPKSPSDAMKLSPGTHFLDGNGVERVR